MDIQKLRDEAKRALGRREIEYLIGYTKGSYGFRISPCFIEKKEEVDQLTFSPLCSLSLVNYLTIEGKPSAACWMTRKPRLKRLPFLYVAVMPGPSTRLLLRGAYPLTSSTSSVSPAPG